MNAIDLSRLVKSRLDRVVAIEYEEPGKAILFRRFADGVKREEMPFEPWLLVSGEELARSVPGYSKIENLEGSGAAHRVRLSFSDLASYDVALKYLKKRTGANPSSPLAPYRVFSDFSQQMLTGLGIRLFRSMKFEEVRRMQLDIETHCGEGHTFCNADLPEDEVTLVSLKDSDGFEICISNKHEGGEAALLKKMIQIIQERDPDVIEGHNIFNFDFSYLEKRCKRYKIPFALGRQGQVAKCRRSQFTAGERASQYNRYDLYGRHVVDTYFLVILYDIIHRDLDSYGLKATAKYFGVAAPNRTYVDGDKISEMYDADSETLMAYCLDDVRETDALSKILSPSYFYQAQLVPFSYQNCVLRGNATRIDALLCAEYLSENAGLPSPQAAAPLQGALSEAAEFGVFRPVWHIDVRSLYPSIIISEKLTPSQDWRGVFLRLLRDLREFRLAAKDAMKSAEGAERDNLNALQGSFKVLINSFYGYTAFVQGTFNDYAMAGRITGRGREILSGMRDNLIKLGALIVEMDTDGIYFKPPEGMTDVNGMEASVQAMLPQGIEVDLDACYEAMFSYKAKNYALLAEDGKISIAGAALKSRGLEPFQRRFVSEFVGLLLKGRESELEALYERYAEDIREHRLPIKDFAKREYLSTSPKVYAEKLAKGETKRSAAYELALKSNREYAQGDGVEFYVTGMKKNVSVTDNCKLLSDASDDVRDENVAFYLDKLKQLHEKFMESLKG